MTFYRFRGTILKEIGECTNTRQTFYLQTHGQMVLLLKKAFVNYTKFHKLCQKQSSEGNSSNGKTSKVEQLRGTLMKFMKLIFVDRTHEERSSLSPPEFYKTAKRISEQEAGVRVLHESPQTLKQENPLGHHQEFDYYHSLIFDLMSRSEHILNTVRAKLKHIGKESGWELAKYQISNTFEDMRYANSLSDDWFRKQAWYNYHQNEALRKKSIVKIHGAAFYFARISRDIHQIAEEFKMTEWAVRKWAKTSEWETALKTFGYTGERSFITKPTRDTKRDNGELFDKAHKAYTGAITDGEPKHKLATIAGNAVGLPRRRIHDWATKYSWKETFFMTFAATTYPFEKLREAIRRPETGHPHLAAVEGGYIDRILEAIEQFRDQLQAQGRSGEYQSVNETLEELEYPLQELRKYFRGDADTHINKRDAEIFISHLQKQVQKWKGWDLTE